MAKRHFEKKSGHKVKKWFFSYDTFSTIKNNFYIGMARGLGTALGFTVLGAVVLIIMQFIPLEKIPFIGELVAEFNNIIRSRLN